MLVVAAGTLPVKQGQQEAFDEVAINYAVTFEVSPPSWEPNRVAAPEPAMQMEIEVPNDPAAEAVSFAW